MHREPLAAIMALFLFIITIFLGPAVAVTNSLCRTSKTDASGALDTPCQFPFTLRNKTYYACTYDYSHITGYKPWCSIKVDPLGNHVSGNGNWGICDDEVNCQIPPRLCGEPVRAHPDIFSDDLNVDILQQPWMVSLGVFASPNKWEHQCGGSLITSTHVLTAAHCFNNIFGNLAKYKMRLGVADLANPSSHGIERRVAKILIHPNYIQNKAYFDVGLAVADQVIEFSNYVRPICLPMRPVDDEDYLDGDLVTLAGWGYYFNTKNEPILGSQLKLINLRVQSRESCEDLFSYESIQKFGLPPVKVKQQLPFGFQKEISCVGNPFKNENACEGDSGSPVVRAFDSTARGITYFEQHFVVSTGIDCRLPATIYTRITDRRILTWIQKETDTAPLIMVVGGFNSTYADNGLLNDVELISPAPNNLCSKHVKPIFANVIEYEDGSVEDEGAILGLTGQFVKDAVIVCGGKNSLDNLNTCYEFDATTNNWNSINSMFERRYQASSVLDEDGDLWVIGGTHDSKSPDYSEIYRFKRKGKGRWRKGRPLPGDLRDTGIDSHCTVRLNSSHVFMAGGFAPAYDVYDPLNAPSKKGQQQQQQQQGIDLQLIANPRIKDQDSATSPDPDIHKIEDDLSTNERIIFELNDTNSDGEEDQRGDDFLSTRRLEKRQALGGGLPLNRAWMYDGIYWERLSDMFEVRDRPACSIVQLADGSIRVLVAGGCNDWCVKNPAIKSAEMYNPDTDEWNRVADLPVPINSAKMELLDGLPTLIGGYDGENKKQNEVLYQYHVEQNVWKPHPHVRMRIARSSAAVFPVPREVFKFC